MKSNFEYLMKLTGVGAITEVIDDNIVTSIVENKLTFERKTLATMITSNSGDVVYELTPEGIKLCEITKSRVIRLSEVVGILILTDDYEQDWPDYLKELFIECWNTPAWDLVDFRTAVFNEWRNDVISGLTNPTDEVIEMNLEGCYNDFIYEMSNVYQKLMEKK